MIQQFEIVFDFAGDGFRGMVTPLMMEGKVYYSVSLEGQVGSFTLELMPAKVGPWGSSWELLNPNTAIQDGLIQAIGDEIEKEEI